MTYKPVVTAYAQVNTIFFQIISVTGNLIYSEVRAFLTKNSEKLIKYMLITTLFNETLTLSQNHLIYTRKADSDDFYPM